MGDMNFNRMEKDLMDHVNRDGAVKIFRKKYNQGVALGVGAILLTALAFAYTMYLLTSDFTLTHALLAGGAVILMIAAIVIVPVRLKRMQAGYMASAGDSAEEYVRELVQKTRKDS